MIGLFLGDTDFSEVVLEKVKNLKIKYFIIDFFKKKINLKKIKILIELVLESLVPY